jgi:hypothetical protein
MLRGHYPVQHREVFQPTSQTEEAGMKSLNRLMPRPDEYSEAVWQTTATRVPHRFTVMDTLMTLDGHEEILIGVMVRSREESFKL